MKKNGNTLKRQRIERINKIRDMIKLASKQGKEVNYNKIVAIICLEEGMARRTIKEYIDLLIDSEELIQEGENLISKH